MATNKTFNGAKNWNHWNVSLWINNDEGLYRMAKDYIREAKDCGGREEAAKMMLDALQESGITHTPDGAPYSVTTIRAAMRGM
jgi:hypothetical protein